MSAPPTSEKHQKTLAGFFEKRKAQSSEDGAEMCDDDAAREEGGNQKEEQTTTTTTENNSPTQQKENIEGAAKKQPVRKSKVLYANAKTSSSAEQTKLDNAKNLQQQDKQPKTSEGLQHTKEKEAEKEPKERQRCQLE